MKDLIKTYILCLLLLTFIVVLIYGDGNVKLKARTSYVYNRY